MSEGSRERSGYDEVQRQSQADHHDKKEDVGKQSPGNAVRCGLQTGKIIVSEIFHDCFLSGFRLSTKGWRSAAGFISTGQNYSEGVAKISQRRSKL